MADNKKKDQVQKLNIGGSEDLILTLFRQVAEKKITMQDAGKSIRAFIGELPEEEQTELRGKLREYGRLLTSVSEAFLAELTVIGAGQ